MKLRHFSVHLARLSPLWRQSTGFVTAWAKNRGAHGKCHHCHQPTATSDRRQWAAPTPRMNSASMRGRAPSAMPRASMPGKIPPTPAVAPGLAAQPAAALVRALGAASCPGGGLSAAAAGLAGAL